MNELTETALQRAVPLGQKLERGLPVREAIQRLEGNFSTAYDRVFKGRNFKITPSDTAAIRAALADPTIRATRQERDAVLVEVTELLNRGRSPAGYSGDIVKATESVIRHRARAMGASQEFTQRETGRLYARAEKALSAWRNKQLPPELRQVAKETDRAYANFKRVQRASTMLGAEEGSFTAAQLQNAVRALSVGKDKGQFARRQAVMQDLSEPAKAVLSGKVPDSGTPERWLLNVGAAGGLGGLGAMVSPEAALGYAAGTAGAWATQPRWMQRYLLGNYPGQSFLAPQFGRVGGVMGATQAPVMLPREDMRSLWK